MVGEISLSDQLLISRITSCLAHPDSGRTYHMHDTEHNATPQLRHNAEQIDKFHIHPVCRY